MDKKITALCCYHKEMRDTPHPRSKNHIDVQAINRGNSVGFEMAVAEYIIETLIKKCKKTFYFESGEFEEKGFYWTDSLSYFGDDSNLYLMNYLKKFDFKSVTSLGQHSTHLTNHKRSLFICKK